MLLILLIFVGQVVSAPLFSTDDCQSDMTHSVMDSMPGHDMSSMDMSTMDMDCCDEECDCPIDMCLSVVLYSNQDNKIQLFSINNNTFPAIVFAFSQHPSSIYRPPILS